MTDSETRVLARTAAVLLVVSAARYGWEARRGPPALPAPEDDGPALLAESRRLQQENDARARPLAAGERIDPNRATDTELDRMPGLGPAAARAIVAEREEKGGFGSVDELLDVPGIGPATMQRIHPFLERSPVGRTVRGGAPPSSRPAVPRLTRAAPAALDLNAASQADLERLPGVGPALAARIIEKRTAKGGFRTPDDLLEVRGIGAATLARLRPLVRVGGGVRR